MEEELNLSPDNPFAQLADPSIVLEVHERFGSRSDFERRVHLKMDAPARRASSEQVAYDATIEAQYALSAVKARRSPAKPGSTAPCEA